MEVKPGENRLLPWPNGGCDAELGWYEYALLLGWANMPLPGV